ncbi:MAG: hypothetical protein KJ621_08055 [Proteobacteria bacterium]|nr:hypothetical protein [Pseudomonadota bacterium]MBU1743140.1 hypothetical protein [Pseudomonadota bacterium]
MAPVAPFRVRDCALVAIATGVRTQNLREFRDGLIEVPPGSIYHHFWGRLLQPQFDEPEYNNDFAAWAYHALHTKDLAERLAVIDPTDYPNIEDLRQEVVEIVEVRLDESEMVPWAKADQQFYFVRHQLVVLDTGHAIEDPAQFAQVIPRMSNGSIFYHFIDARRRTWDRRDDLSSYLASHGDTYAGLAKELSAVDPYFSSLPRMREVLTELFRNHFPGVTP